MVIEYGQGQRAKVKNKVAVVELVKPDVFADETLADEDHLAAPADSSISTDVTRLDARWILDLWQAQRIGSRRRGVKAGWGYLAQSLVRADRVVIMPEAVKHPLLRSDVSLWGFGGLHLESKMHAFVLTVLLGMSRLYAFGAYAEFDPPDGEPRQARKAVAGEWRAIVASDDFWHAVFPESRHPYWLHGFGVGASQRLTSEKRAGVSVSDC